MTTSIHKRHYRLGVALFFIVLTAIGLFTVRDYGTPFDELVEMQILESTIKEYALRLSPNTETSYLASMKRTRLLDMTDRDRGVSAYYPLAFLMRLIREDIRLYSLCWSILTWCIFMLGCISLYGVLRAMGASRVIAAAGTLLLYLSPRFFAEGHYIVN